MEGELDGRHRLCGTRRNRFLERELLVSILLETHHARHSLEADFSTSRLLPLPTTLHTLLSSDLSLEMKHLLTTSLILTLGLAFSQTPALEETLTTYKNLESSNYLQKRDAFILDAPAVDLGDWVGQFNDMLKDCSTVMDSVLEAPVQLPDANMKYIFGDDSPQTGQETLDMILNLQDVCLSTVEPNIVVYLNESLLVMPTDPIPHCQCSDPPLPGLATMSGYTLPADNTIVLCEAYYSLPSLPIDCWSQYRVGEMMTFMEQLPSVMDDSEYSQILTGFAWGSDVLRETSPEVRMSNYDSWRLFAQQCYMKCEDGVRSYPIDPDSP